MKVGYRRLCYRASDYPAFIWNSDLGAGFLEKLNKAVCLRFPNNTDRHRIALVDRGESFYKSNGKITHGFVTALRKQGLTAFNQSRTNPGTNPGPIPGLVCAGPRTWSLPPSCACHLAILFFFETRSESSKT